MNRLLLNRDGFQMPADGWYQIAPLGEFVHAAAGLVQVVDAEACAAMASRFAQEAQGDHFAGLLVDFDHFSLDGEKRSEAAGWIVGLEARPEGAGFGVQGSGGEASTAKDAKGREGENSGTGVGLFAKIRWSDVGEESVKGGRYRFLSPVWNRADCVELGDGKVRPMRLLNAAVTNDPNLKGMRPLSNRGQSSEVSGQNGENSYRQGVESDKENGKLANTGGAERFKWVLGVTDSGTHCPSCQALDGQVHTMAEWQAAGVQPGGDRLYCQGNCHCRLEPTTDAASGALGGVPKRRDAPVGNSGTVANGWTVENGRTVGNGRTVERFDGETIGEQLRMARMARNETVANVGWTSEARVASLEVRRQKAQARGTESKERRSEQLLERQRASLERASKDYEAIYTQKGFDGMSTEERKYMAARIGLRARNGAKLTSTEERYVKEEAQQAVATAKEKQRKAPGKAERRESAPVPAPVDDGIYLGGSKDFDEATGRYRTPPGTRGRKRAG